MFIFCQVVKGYPNLSFCIVFIVFEITLKILNLAGYLI